MNLLKEWNELWANLRPGPVAQAKLRSFVTRAEAVCDNASVTSQEYRQALAALHMAQRSARWFDEGTYFDGVGK